MLDQSWHLNITHAMVVSDMSEYWAGRGRGITWMNHFFLPLPALLSLLLLRSLRSDFSLVSLLLLFPPLAFSGFTSFSLLLLLRDSFCLQLGWASLNLSLAFLHSTISAWYSASSFPFSFSERSSHSSLALAALPSSTPLALRSLMVSILNLKQAVSGLVGGATLIVQIKLCVLLNHMTLQTVKITIPGLYHQMKPFAIGEVLLYDPARLSSKRKPIEIDIQEAKIVAYWPPDVELEQKCNTVGMAEGVYSFCKTLRVGKERSTASESEADPLTQKENERGWQIIDMDECTLVLSEVEEGIWLFMRLDHAAEQPYRRLSADEDEKYLDSNLSEETCRRLTAHFYRCFTFFHGPVRGWVFRDRLHELQQLLNHLVSRYQQLFCLGDQLDALSYTMPTLRVIPLDVNSNLKFTYFKNVLRSYDQNIEYLAIFAHGMLVYSNLNTQDTHFLANYLFSTGQPYLFNEQKRKKFQRMTEMPTKATPGIRVGTLYNSRRMGYDESSEQRGSLAVSKVSKINTGTDLLGLEEDAGGVQLFEAYLSGEEQPFRVNFYHENNMQFVTFYKQSPPTSQLIFQNRFFHDNADKFLVKINEIVPALQRGNDPYRFVFHNAASYSGKSTLSVRDWKVVGQWVKEMLENMCASREGMGLSMTKQGWVVGLHRYSRVLVLLLPADVSMHKVEEVVGRMTKEYFSKAYI